MSTESSVARELPRRRLPIAPHSMILDGHEIELLQHIDKAGGAIELKSLKVESKKREMLMQARDSLLKKGVIVELTSKPSAAKLRGPKLLAALQGKNPAYLKIAERGETQEGGKPSILKISPAHAPLVRQALASRAAN